MCFTTAGSLSSLPPSPLAPGGTPAPRRIALRLPPQRCQRPQVSQHPRARASLLKSRPVDTYTTINRPFKIMYTPGLIGVCGARPWSLWGRCKRALASTYRGGAGALHAGIAALRIVACECASCFDFFERLSRACLGELIDILTELGKSRENDERVPLLTVFILAARCANAAARTLPGHMLVLGVTPAKMLSHFSCIVFICPEPVLANDRFSPES